MTMMDKFIHDVVLIGMVEIFQGKKIPTRSYLSFTINMDLYNRASSYPIIAEINLVNLFTIASFNSISSKRTTRIASFRNPGITQR